MRPSLSLALSALLVGVGCGSKETTSQPSQEPPPAASAEAQSPEEVAPAAEDVHVRALFYYERGGPDGVTPYPSSADHSPRGEGEKAWLEVHTNGAAHAYAFALFADGDIEMLWSEDIKKKKHTPPMNAFGDGLQLSEKFRSDSTLLVVASSSPIEGLDQLSSCSTTATAACNAIAGILDSKVPETPPASALRMRHMDVETPAYGGVNSGADLSAVTFPIKGR